MADGPQFLTVLLRAELSYAGIAAIVLPLRFGQLPEVCVRGL